MKTLIQSCMMLLVMTVLLGLIYPMLVTGAGQTLFRDKAAGSLIVRDGQAVASSLIAQKITSPKYFWPRPSAADYDAANSSGTNLGPTSADLKKQYEERRKKLMETHPGEGEPPQDLLFASASGLDPEISPAAALYQLNRVIKARSLNPEQAGSLKTLIEQHRLGPMLGFMGEARVNIMELNTALDRMN
jgi:potassium-transporting ATPase KdpC subunit